MQIHKRNAAAGWLWISQSVHLLIHHKVIGLAFFCTSLFLTKALLAVPVVGYILTTLLQPILLASVFVMIDTTTMGRPVSVAGVISEIRPHLSQLLRVGFAYAGVIVLSAGIVQMLTGNPVLAMAVAGDSVAFNKAISNELTSVMYSAVLLAGIASAVLFFASWFAPPLILFRGCSAKAAMKQSLVAVGRNFKGFLLLGIILAGSWLGYFLMMYLLPGSILTPIGRQDLLLPAVTLLSGLYWPIAGPIILATVFVGYKDVFETAPNSQASTKDSNG